MYYRILSVFGLQGFEIISVVEYYREVFIFVYHRRLTGDCPGVGKETGLFMNTGLHLWLSTIS